jgi:hypothetical protein
VLPLWPYRGNSRQALLMDCHRTILRLNVKSVRIFSIVLFFIFLNSVLVVSVLLKQKTRQKAQMTSSDDVENSPSLKDGLDLRNITENFAPFRNIIWMNNSKYLPSLNHCRKFLVLQPSELFRHLHNTYFERSTLFWDIKQNRVVILYRSFGITYRSHLQESWCWDR